MSHKNIEPQKKPLILIAEDIPKNMEVVCNILRKAGYRIAMAGDGQQALKMVANVKPDLILLDIMMPEMDGFEACRHLKNDPETKEIPIIFLTAKTDTIDVVKGFELGAVDYIVKPFKGAELLSRVKTHLELKFSREALKELNATKDKFFSIIAHDLKDPLSFLLLSADSLCNHYDSLSETKRKDYVRRFHNNSQQIAALLENLLVWARSQSGGIKIKREKIDIGTLVVETVDLLQEHAGKKNIELSSPIEPGIIAFADKNMVQTIIRNLVANGIKFTHPGGKITINASIEENKNWVEISVSDTGVGISPGDIDGLFRLDVIKTTRGTDNEKGSGLGLILCKEFVKKNNGSIEVTSEPGKGSCFTFTLPHGMGDR